MRCLAVSQMNMMQVVLQKVAYRSKDIQKKEKYVNNKLRCKKVQLESPCFSLTDVLYKSLQVASKNTQPKQLCLLYTSDAADE